MTKQYFYKLVKHGYLGQFAILWPIVLLFPLVYFPLPSVLFGHPWKVELAMSFLLGLSLTYLLSRSLNNRFFLAISSQTVSWIIAPCVLFIFWSALSVSWAGSALSVVHHTLLWVCYLIFLLFAIQIAANRKSLILTVFSLSTIIGIIATLCIIEYTFATQINEVFGFRYARFAEMHAAVLPLFFSFVLRFKRKHFGWAILMTVLVWLALLFSLSRGALLSAIVGLFIFILLRVLTRQTYAEKKRLILATAGIALISALVQIPISGLNQRSQSMISRFSIQDEDLNNSVQKNIRILFNSVGLEMFTNNVIKGVGADNFGLEFNKYRALFSNKIENRAVAEQKEELYPERAHNEYLQVLAELGLIGGLFFAWLLFGIARFSFVALIKDRLLKSNILDHAAIAGMIAFLCSSLFSSFSFRLMQNGLVFFFLLAILLRSYSVQRNQEKILDFAKLNYWNSVSILIAIVLCFSLTAFSTFKAASQFFTFQGENERNLKVAKLYFEKAERLDPANAAANLYLGVRLRDDNQFQESSRQLKEAVTKGLNPMGSYSYWISSQVLANDFEGAKNTASEAVKIFPYSVFARVRYGSMLEKLKLKDEAAEQYEIAKQLNKRQAETWQLLINEGSLVTIEKAKSNDAILSLDKLNPSDAIYAVLSERQILHPEEKIKMEFNN